jgi:hypothetical protein
MPRPLQEQPDAFAGRWFRNTAELSGELSVGDVVAVGEVALAVGRPAGWVPVRGSLTEVRIREHGTHPLPLPQPGPAFSAGSAPGATEGEQRDE